ncbi:hypothetical protein DHEL01_v205276 [Diaporthe helianthi]|uniref:BZIP domain-containing protein n=1 Tax=Diaporthe helianthi TaxID=158607 RepID=A0A2P5I1C3_DIAHE|nr:hypothetical protein DHEL01_v205276 [Diaporthe helianthi]
MSQRGAASRPPSRRRSQSLSTGANASPSSLQRAHPYGNDGGVDPARDPSRVFVAPDDLPRQTTPRTLGVHNILNPSEPRETQIRTSPSLQRAGVGCDSSPSSSGTRQYGVSGSPYQPYGVAPAFGAPPGPTAPLGSLASILPRGQRESPSQARPFPPALGAARRILTPRSPRSLSLGRVTTPAASGDTQPPFDFSTPLVGRFGATQEMAPFPGPPGLTSGMPGQSPRAIPPTPVASTATMDHRGFSQAPFANTPSHHFSQGHIQHGAAGGPQRMAPAYAHGQFESIQGSGRGYAHQGSPPAEANLSSAIMSALQLGGGGGTRGPDSQPHLTLQTNTGEHITVPLDVHQGSRQADEKRHRNAGASARFRARKKERDKDLRENMQRLENENREFTRQIHELHAERDFYRSERNRLRDVVLRTPSIREHAEQGPPSPQPSRAAASGGATEGSFTGSYAAGGSSSTTSPSLAHQQRSPPYAEEQLERPSRRRRTDPTAADFSPAPYAMRPAQPPGSLPPIVTQGYTGPISSAPPSARLPPLRFDQPASSPTTAHQTGFESQTPPLPHQTQYYGRPPPHEMGWATSAREPQDPSRR